MTNDALGETAIAFGTFITDPSHWDEAPDADLVALVAAIARACRRVGDAAALGRLMPFEATVTINVQGETQKPLDIIANDIFINECGPFVRGLVSEEMEEPLYGDERVGAAPYLLLIDPLDGSDNSEMALAAGAFFSVLRAPSAEVKPEDFLQTGDSQIVAGYALYGSTTMLVVTFGRGVQGFTLHPGAGVFRLTHPDMTLAHSTRNFAINASNQRFWEPPVQLFFQQCQDGADGLRGEDYNMRWNGALVAELNRILLRGGVYLYPWDNRKPARKGRLRLLYEANPVAKLIEAAGGAASTGRERILDITPREVHERTPLIFGSKDEVKRLVTHHLGYDRGEPMVFRTPLLHRRSLFRRAGGVNP
jgi:fructose-1,6-bisphosphatase